MFSLVNYADFVRQQIKDLEIGQYKQADVGQKDLQTFRMNLSQIGARSGLKYKTKVIDGDLYIARIK